jgi:hypothetical protein
MEEAAEINAQFKKLIDYDSVKILISFFRFRIFSLIIGVFNLSDEKKGGDDL